MVKLDWFENDKKWWIIKRSVKFQLIRLIEWLIVMLYKWWLCMYNILVRHDWFEDGLMIENQSAIEMCYWLTNWLIDWLVDVNHWTMLYHFAAYICSSPGGGRGEALAFWLDIILVKVLLKHTLSTYFSGMKIDPKYTFLYAFFLICPSCPFQNLSLWPKTHLFFQFCTFLHP